MYFWRPGMGIIFNAWDKRPDYNVREKIYELYGGGHVSDIEALKKHNRELQKHNTELVLRNRELSQQNRNLEAVLAWFRSGQPNMAEIKEALSESGDHGDEAGTKRGSGQAPQVLPDDVPGRG